MASPGRIELSDNRYTVKQKAVRNAYNVYNSDGDEVLRTKQKLFKMREEFPFTDPDGNEVFRVKAEKVMDIAGDYAITDAETVEKIAVLGKNFTIFTHSWDIKGADGDSLGYIESRGKLVGFLRFISDVFALLPHRYSIENAEGEKIGTIKGKFSLRDRYEIELEEGVENREAIIVAAITIDALEGN